ncbi:MAG: hypothetical protein H7A12_03935 [Pseudomonadales bacterium]|jgi:hypothetical protein|nr:hypothetical protein [Pseudomonadales bacterium]MCP5319962.1 hypothetical protein [Pseudomonadales bacterium]
MSSDEFERIKPAKIDMAITPATGAVTASRASLPIPALVIGTLLLLAAAVFFLLPDYITRQRGPTVAATTPASSAAPQSDTGAATAQPSETPYAAATTERQRAAAKEALDAVLTLQHELQQRGAENWAATELAQATALATAGDLAYREGDHATAQARYAEAASLLRATLAGIEERLQDRLARAAAALAAGNSAEAGTLFGEALAIDPGNTTAQHGLQRAGTLDRVLELASRAGAAEAAGDDALAQRSYEEALALDSEHAPARKGLDELRARAGERSYRLRLSAGFAALARGDPGAAAGEFRAALALRKDSPEARDGLQQAEFQLTQRRISARLASARQAIAAERWTDARREFDAALAIDATLDPALEGSQQAARRIALDEALVELERNPERLLDPGTRARTEELITRTAAISDPGRRLQAQLATARRLLGAYSTPVALHLRSDGQTEVSVLRIGSYGTMTDKALELLPGDYVAVGRRTGYRDVRIAFRIRPGQAPGEVLVQCVEKV